MTEAPLSFQIHTIIGLGLFLVLPFTRLVHAFAVPLHYLFRPYVLYRCRRTPAQVGSRAPSRGWERVGS